MRWWQLRTALRFCCIKALARAQQPARLSVNRLKHWARNLGLWPRSASRTTLAQSFLTLVTGSPAAYMGDTAPVASAASTRPAAARRAARASEPRGGGGAGELALCCCASFRAEPAVVMAGPWYEPCRGTVTVPHCVVRDRSWRAVREDAM